MEGEAEEEDPARRRLRGEARRALLWEHLLVWVPGYARAAVRVGAAAYRPWAEALASALLAEAVALPRGDGPLPLHLRQASAPAAPGDDGLDDYLGRLLAPVRSGMVITRQDLAIAARDLGLGLRLGERRFALRNLVGQDASAVFSWLAEWARVSAEDHGRLIAVLGPVAVFWQERAHQAEAHLRQLEEEIRSPVSARG